MAKALYVLSASVSKSEPGRTIFTHMQGYRVCESEDEAKGNFVTAVMKEKPGFSISELLCLAIPEDALRLALSQGEKP